MNLTKVKYNEAKDNYFFIDVRSPSEYDTDTIPNSVNIPILNDDERKDVGATYTQIGKDEAKRLGVNLISPKMPGIFEQVLQIKKDHSQVASFCARGGYRSSFFSSVFSAIGIPVAQLEGGYKEYRKYIIDTIPLLNDIISYIVLHGNTGVGKTDILHSLKNAGFSVLDLEGAANHRGSFLGSIGIGKCNSQKNFETNLYMQLKDVKYPYVFVEAESHKIGNVIIPHCINQKIDEGIHILIDADIDYRIMTLKKDYILNDNWISESVDAVKNLEKYISKKNIEIIIKEIINGNFDYVAKELMEKYYDPMYNFNSDKIKFAQKFKASINSDLTAEGIIDWFRSANLNKK